MTDDELQHHGVKGQKWGVRKEYEASDRSAAMQKYLKSQGLNAPMMEKKYGPDSMVKPKSGDARPKEDHDGLSRNQKIAIGVGGVALVGIGSAVAYKYLQANPGAAGEIAAFFKQPPSIIETAYKNSADGFALHWDKGLDLPAGTIFQRASTIAEDTIRPNGFFAAFHPDDVERYKAVLPEFWKQWGLNANEGYMVQMRAKVPIKAPSGKETMELMKQFHYKNSGAASPFSTADNILGKQLNLQAAAMESFSWAGPEGHPEFFEYVKSKGYNALIDFNDAGKLAKTPVRVIDSAAFEIAGHNPLSTEAIKAAQDKLLAAVHSDDSDSLMGVGILKTDIPTTQERKMKTIDELRHHGVKGQKWGVRKDGSTSSTSVRTSHLARKPKDVTVKQRPGKFVTTSGGRKQSASDDAVKVAAARQVAKVSTTDSLTTRQLQEAVTRMNLEQQYSKLAKQVDRRTRGQRFINKLLGTGPTPDKNQQTKTMKVAKTAAAAAVKKAVVVAAA